MRHHLEEIMVVDHRFDHVLHVIGDVRIIRNHLLQRFHFTADIVGTRYRRRILHIVRWQETQQLADAHQRLLLRIAHEMRHTALAAMHIGTTQFLFLHRLMRNGLHDIRSGYEHMALLFHHKNEIGQCRRVTSSAGTRTEDSRNLGYHPGSHRILIEDRCITSQTADPFLDARTSRIVQGNHRCTVL